MEIWWRRRSCAYPGTAMLSVHRNINTETSGQGGLMTSGAGDDLRGTRNPGGVQSIERVFELLETMADAGGVIGLSQLASQSGLPLPTIHRLVRTLVDLGYVRQEPSREYALGPRLIRLGESSSTMLSVFARPHLARLVDELGESANMAMLDGDQIVYLAQVPSRDR